LRFCDNSSCEYCIRGQCVSSIVKLAAVTMGDKPAVLACQTYERGERKNGN